eukprot:5691691-Prymnesium_polylepis.2
MVGVVEEVAVAGCAARSCRQDRKLRAREDDSGSSLSPLAPKEQHRSCRASCRHEGSRRESQRREYFEYAHTGAS